MVPGVRLVVLGKQGAGKGTQCVRLSHHYVVPHISTGDMLRAAVKTGSDLGLKVKETMDRGELLGDDIIMEMVAERLAEPDARARGFILDGCPRTTHQAETLAAHDSTARQTNFTPQCPRCGCERVIHLEELKRSVAPAGP